MPSQQEAPAAGGLGPRRHGPSGGDGTLGVEPARPSKSPQSSGLFAQAHSSSPPSALTLGYCQKSLTRVGRNTFLLPAYSSLQANLSTHRARVCHSNSSFGVQCSLLHLPGVLAPLLRPVTSPPVLQACAAAPFSSGSSLGQQLSARCLHHCAPLSSASHSGKI